MVDIQTDVYNASARTTDSLTASDLVGFLLDSEFTDDEDWHTVYNGGTATGPTDSTVLDVNLDAVVGDWQILKLEIDPNGTVRWYVDGVVVRTVVGAVSTSVDLAMFCGVGTPDAFVEDYDFDYVLLEMNRDWTV